MLSTIFKRPLKTTFILKVSLVLLLLLFFLIRYLDGFMFVALDWVKIVLFNSLPCCPEPQLSFYLMVTVLFCCFPGLSDAVAASWGCFDWCCTCDGFDFVPVFCRVAEEKSHFYIFCKVAAVIPPIVDLWHSKQNDSTVYFFTDIYLLFFFSNYFIKAIAFFCVCVWRASGTRGGETGSRWHFTIRK